LGLENTGPRVANQIDEHGNAMVPAIVIVTIR
jgi:hypothetical protein